jgi:peptidoglycan hydrolase-like protein with peptidoglycan-binding domain
VEGLDYLGTEPYIGHGGGHHGGGGQRWAGGNPQGWGWYNQPVIVVEESPYDEMWALLGEDVKVSAAQVALKSAGFVGKDGKPLTIDGIMGPNTTFAIAAFWASKGESHAPVVDEDLMKALPAPTAPTAPADGRPAKGWSQPQPGAMGPAVTPGTPDAAADKKKWYVIAGGAAAVAIGVALFVFGGRKG